MESQVSKQVAQHQFGAGLDLWLHSPLNRQQLRIVGVLVPAARAVTACYVVRLRHWLFSSNNNVACAAGAVVPGQAGELLGGCACICSQALQLPGAGLQLQVSTLCMLCFEQRIDGLAALPGRLPAGHRSSANQTSMAMLSTMSCQPRGCVKSWQAKLCVLRCRETMSGAVLQHGQGAEAKCIARCRYSTHNVCHGSKACWSLLHACVCPHRLGSALALSKTLVGDFL